MTQNNKAKAEKLIENYIRLKVRKMLKEENDPWKQGGEYRLLQDKFGKMKMKDIVAIVNSNTKWNYENITELVYLLLIDANFHSEAPKVKKFMNELD